MSDNERFVVSICLLVFFGFVIVYALLLADSPNCDRHHRIALRWAAGCGLLYIVAFLRLLR